jgi:hypothetical protein
VTVLGRRRLPDEARGAAFAAAPLGAHERVLEWSPVDPGGWCVASTFGLRCPDDYALLRWDEVRHVAYTAPVIEVEHMDGRPARRLRLQEPRRLAEVVRERVTASIPYDRHFRLTGDGRGVRIVARRRPDTDELTWLPTYDEGLDPDDPVIRARAEAALYDARSLF